MRNGYRRTILFHVGLLFVVGLSAGCELEGFDQTGGSVMPATIAPRKEWTIKARGAVFHKIDKAIDSSKSSAAVSGRNYTNGTVTVNLGRTSYFNSVAILHGPNPGGYARQVALSTSLDGRRYTHQETVYGTRKVTYILLVQPVRARFIRFTAVRQGATPWSISQIFLQ